MGYVLHYGRNRISSIPSSTASSASSTFFSLFRPNTNSASSSLVPDPLWVELARLLKQPALVPSYASNPREGKCSSSSSMSTEKEHDNSSSSNIGNGNSNGSSNAGVSSGRGRRARRRLEHIVSKSSENSSESSDENEIRSPKKRYRKPKKLAMLVVPDYFCHDEVKPK